METLSRTTYSSSSVYDDLPIDRSKQQIRLWRFASEEDGSRDPGHLVMEVFDMASCPDYVALSYTWGSLDDVQPISINGGQLAITSNLSKFIADIFDERWRGESKTVPNTSESETGLSRHAGDDHPTRGGIVSNSWYWSDQITINQRNLKERGHQVDLMAIIFSQASTVLAYLCPDDGEEKFEYSPCDSPELDPQLRDPMLIDLFAQPYWTRLWIVQEALLARELVFLYRKQSIKRVSLLVSLKCYLMGEPWPSYSNIHTRHNLSAVQQQMDIKIRWLLQGWYINNDAVLVKDGIRQGTADLLWILLKICQSPILCSDPRDRVYGIQAVVAPEQRIRIDYSLSPAQVMHEALRIMILNKTNEGGTKWTFWYNGIFQQINQLANLELRMDVAKGKDRCARILSWAHLLALWPNGIRGNLSLDKYSLKRCCDRMLATAITVKQKLVAAEIHDLIFVLDDSGDELDQTKRTECHARNNLTRTSGDVLHPVLHAACERHGFRQYGQFLAHPDEWPFLSERMNSSPTAHPTPRDTFEFRKFKIRSDMFDVASPSLIDDWSFLLETESSEQIATH